MREHRWLAVALATVVAWAAFAGEKGKKCEMGTQDCLTKMASELARRGWVGIEMEDAGARLTVKRVVAGSPAEAAGLRPGDVLVALNGTSFAEKDRPAIKAAYKAMTPGAKAVYTVERDGSPRTVEVTLGKLPEEILAQWVGAHMLESHARTADN